MTIDKYPSLHQTVRVAADGTITHGIPVPRVRSSEHAPAYPPMRAHNRKRYGGLSDVPDGVDQRADLKNFGKQVSND